MNPKRSHSVQLSRWLVVTLLSTSTVGALGAGAWWWVTWPQRTLRTFEAHIAAERFEQANELIEHPPAPAGDYVLDGTLLRSRIEDDLVVEDPSFLDIVIGRRIIDGLFGRGAGGGVYVFVERGRIRVTDATGTAHPLTVR
jgi:hypothetical protein